MAEPLPADHRIRLIYLVFFAQAFAGGSLFARVPDIQQQAGLSETQLGLVLTAASVGGLLSLVTSGQLIQRCGTLWPLVLGLPTLSLAQALVTVMPSLIGMMVLMVLVGAAFSISNVAMNVEADRIEATTGRRVMNRCHGIWSLGMLATSLLGVLARAIPATPTQHFLCILPVSVLTAIYIALRMTPAAEPR